MLQFVSGIPLTVCIATPLEQSILLRCLNSYTIFKSILVHYSDVAT